MTARVATGRARSPRRRQVSTVAVSLLAVALPTGIALLFAFSRLGDFPLWRDEVATVVSSGRSLPGTLAILWHREANMSLYYLMMNGWLRLGHGELWLRLPSAVFGVGTVAVTVLFARRAFDNSIAIIAGLLLATNGLLMWYAHQARSYALVALLASSSALFLLLAVEKGGAARWAMFVASGTAIVYSQVLASVVVLGQLGTLLAARPSVLRSWRPVAWSAGLWVLLASPALGYALFAGRGQIDWLNKPGWSELVQTGRAFFNTPVLA